MTKAKAAAADADPAGPFPVVSQGFRTLPHLDFGCHDFIHALLVGLRGIVNQSEPALRLLDDLVGCWRVSTPINRKSQDVAAVLNEFEGKKRRAPRTGAWEKKKKQKDVAR